MIELIVILIISIVFFFIGKRYIVDDTKYVCEKDITGKNHYIEIKKKWYEI